MNLLVKALRDSGIDACGIATELKITHVRVPSVKVTFFRYLIDLACGGCWSRMERSGEDQYMYRRSL